MWASIMLLPERSGYRGPPTLLPSISQGTRPEGHSVGHALGCIHKSRTQDRLHTGEAKCSRGEPLLGNLVVKICGPCGKRAFGLFVCFETGFHGVAQADLKLFV